MFEVFGSGILGLFDCVKNGLDSIGFSVIIVRIGLGKIKFFLTLFLFVILTLLVK
jgi:hypothetical protein